MFKRLLPRRWRRQVQRQGLQGVEVIEALKADLTGSLRRYRAGELCETELKEQALEAAILGLLRLLLEEE